MKCPRSIAMLAVAGVGLFGSLALSVPADATPQKPISMLQADPGAPCPTGSSAPVGGDCEPPCPVGAPSHDPSCPPGPCDPVPGGPAPTECPDQECPPVGAAPAPADCPGTECPPAGAAPAPANCPDPCPPKTWVDATGKAHVGPSEECNPCPDDGATATTSPTHKLVPADPCDPCADFRNCPPPAECEGMCKRPPVIWNPNYTG
jgi:serine/threonine-protein kinase